MAENCKVDDCQQRGLRAEIERLRALLARYQAANYIPEDCDLYAETKAALNQQLGEKQK